jgi:hypothetical protein
MLSCTTVSNSEHGKKFRTVFLSIYETRYHHFGANTCLHVQARRGVFRLLYFTTLLT